MKMRIDQRDVLRKIRKEMPPPGKVIETEKDRRKKERFDWRKEIEVGP